MKPGDRSIVPNRSSPRPAASAGLAVAVLAWLLAVAPPARAGLVVPPPGWQMAGQTEGFEVRLDPTGGRGGSACALLVGTNAAKGAWVAIHQFVDAEPYRGRKLRVSAWIRTEDVAQWGSLYVRLGDVKGRKLLYRNHRNKPARGTAGWRRFEVTVDVPESAAGLDFGVFLFGSGTLRVDDFSLEVVGGP